MNNKTTNSNKDKIYISIIIVLLSIVLALSIPHIKQILNFSNNDTTDIELVNISIIPKETNTNTLSNTESYYFYPSSTNKYENKIKLNQSYEYLVTIDNKQMRVTIFLK